jgi:hypothetical protein
MKNLLLTSLLAAAVPAAAQVPEAPGKPVALKKIACVQEVWTDHMHARRELTLEKTATGWSAKYMGSGPSMGKNLSIPDLNSCHFYKADPRVFACHKGTREAAWASVVVEKKTTESIDWSGDGAEHKGEYLEVVFAQEGGLDTDAKRERNMAKAVFAIWECKAE